MFLGVEGRVPHAQLGARGDVARGGEVHVAAVLEGRQVLVAGLRRRPHQHHPVAVVLVGGVEAHGVAVLLEHLRARAARYPAVCASVCVRVCVRVGSGGWWLLNNLGDATSQAKPSSVRALSRHLVMGGPRETLRQVRLVRGQREGNTHSSLGSKDSAIQKKFKEEHAETHINQSDTN